ncbi:DUF1553 domain-containing protein [Schlesneria sp. T3-172]|uniref:DUF1553 domain-containing protein n=1 Tax=Schlesneria sphaerica TaxID=3373610 RepID=UPI0037C6E626
MKNLSLALAILFASWPVLRAAETPGEVLFEPHIRPILKSFCFHCHGEEETVEGKLDLRLARLMVSGGEGGPAIVPGNADKSLLLERIRSGEMPPGEKKLTPEQVNLITRWVAGGAKTARPEPEKPLEGDFTDEERAFWSVQPIRKPAVPAVQHTEQVRSPIDQFLLAVLESKDWDFSEPADRLTLVRRLSFDLHGLPPSPDTVERFVNDPAPDAVERLTDELLASPRYGERWGRHWLDVAGYADSDGYTEADPVRDYAFKYRDYVIRAFNSDKPFDQFIVEQLAGDELVTYPYENLSPDATDKLAATGFLRMAPDGTASGGVDVNAASNEVIAETIKIVSTSMLGMTVGCAQCHNHRYDPITQADYYRFRAVFEPGYNTKAWRAPGSRLISLWSADQRLTAKVLGDAEYKLSEQRGRELNAIVQEVFEREVNKLPEAQRAPARQARATSADKRTPEQQQILKETPSLNVDGGSVYLYEPARIDEFNRRWDERIAQVRSLRPAEDYVSGFTEIPGQVPPTHLFYRGEINQPKQEVTPAELSIVSLTSPVEIAIDDPQVPTTGRRLAYARNLTSGKHPLLSRVMVNRFWMHHFGKGIVATPGDFGYLGERPSHPELLDWLATRFVSDGWQLKRFHRLLLGSTAFQQRSQRRPEIDAADPDNRLLARMPVRRLEAEEIRDSMLSCSGSLSDKMYGKPAPVAVDEVGQVIVGLPTLDLAGGRINQGVSLREDEFRRSIYVQVRRSLPLGMLEPFDMATLSPNCDIRQSSTVAPQALLMMNNSLVVREAEKFADRVRKVAGDNISEQVKFAWVTAFTRPPTERELAGAIAFLTEQTEQVAAKVPADQAGKEPSPAQVALASFCQGLLSANLFLYVD